MSPVTHFLTSWMIANTAPLERRERAIVALSGLAPDIDGLGLAVDIATRGTAWETNWWGEYHHTLGHNLLFALVAGTIALSFARSHRLMSFALAVAVVHLHLLCDVSGGRGPEGYQWPIPYLWPFAPHPQWVWSGQWALNAWPNLVITGICILVTVRLACCRGFSPVELVSLHWDRKVVETLRQRFPRRSVD